jgi:ABC-type transport system involved in cytochrome c biogenesis permease subunit
MENILLLITSIIYLLAFAAGLFRQRGISLYAMYLGIAVHTALIITRTVLAQHLPLSNVYETVLLLTWLLQIRFIFFQKQVNIQIIHFQRILVILLLLLPMFIQPEFRAVRPLMPEYKNVWMYIHVLTDLMAYVFLFSGFVLAFTDLFAPKKIFPYDKHMDTDIRIAMLLLSCGLLAGLIWGQISRGSYWSWQPKEIWSLINIMILSLYLHMKDRHLRSIIVVVTVLTVLFTFIGLGLGS